MIKEKEAWLEHSRAQLTSKEKNRFKFNYGYSLQLSQVPDKTKCFSSTLKPCGVFTLGSFVFSRQMVFSHLTQ